MKSRPNRQPSQYCPSCRRRAKVTATRVISERHTERYYRCTNIECGHQFKTITEITETIVPPLNPAEKEQQELVLKAPSELDNE